MANFAMVAVKPAEIRRLLETPPRHPVFLVFGPDQGLVAERVARLVSLVTEDDGDPFRVLRLDGDTIAQAPPRLADEANTIGLFGGKRAIIVRAGAKSIVAAVKPLLETPPLDSVVVIQAGDLARTAPLRTLCERSPAALALPCYPDGPREVAGLVDDVMTSYGLRIEDEARSHLLALLGADRQASRNELEKVALYAYRSGVVDVAAVDAVCGDAAALAYDALVDAVFSGNLQEVDLQAQRLFADGADPGVLLGVIIRHGWALLTARSQIDRGTPPSAAVERMRVHFRRKDTVQRQLGLWRVADLQRLLLDHSLSISNSRRQSAVSSSVSMAAMWGIAMRAARRRRS